MSDQPGLWRRLDATGIPLLLCRLVLGGLFIYMGLKKTADPVAFMKLIHLYKMTPDALWWLLNLIAVTLPWIEVLCGLLLLLGVAVRGSALTLLAMLLVFTPVVALRAIDIYTTSEIAFCGIAFDCGCGAGVVKICHKLPENISLSLLCVITILSRSTWLCLRAKLIPTR